MSESAAFTVRYVGEETAPDGEVDAVREAARRAGALFREGRADADHEAAGERHASDRLVLVGPPPALAAAAALRPGAALVAILDDARGDGRLAGLEDRTAGAIRRPADASRLGAILPRAGALAALHAELAELRGRVADQGRELRELHRIGAALSTERHLDTLLALILSKCRAITSADAGSLYLVERRDGAEPDERDPLADKELVFRLAQNDSVDVPFRETRMVIDRRSLAGWAALAGETLNIEDAYAIPETAEYRFNRAFDDASSYRTRSLLVVPMRNHRDEVIGVLQLINRRRDRTRRLAGRGAEDSEVIPFDARTAELASSLASQAAIAIENARLYEAIRTLFEGFIRASVTAIESRDPTTSGHSERVAILTVDLARKVDRASSGPYGPVRFTRDDLREIEYACLLHDFGKIGVRESVLLKEKKLYPGEMRAIEDRFRLLRATLRLRAEREKVGRLVAGPREAARAAIAAIDRETADRIADLDRWLAAISRSNEPTVLEERTSAILQSIAGRVLEGAEGEPVRLLDPWEAANLGIGKGSLSPEERREIESHVTHTFEFLSTIPWTRELDKVPRIAGAHHEKLDGSGYPTGLRADRIPVESRMMTIADIFDALTAKDRPYKRHVPAPRALEILEAEVREGKVDPHLFEIFVEGRVWEQVVNAS